MSYQWIIKGLIFVDKEEDFDGVIALNELSNHILIELLWKLSMSRWLWELDRAYESD